MLRAPRSGFTLVETIVALVLLQVAMLALAATAAVAARDLSDAIVRRRAWAIAQSGAERLRPAACSAIQSGSRMLDGRVSESWRTDAMGRARSVTDSVTAPLSRGRQAAAVARVWVLCAS